MKNISNSLTTFLLDNVVFGRADLISIALPNGQVMNVIDGTNYTTITYPTNLPANVTISGKTEPWNYTDPTYPFTNSGQSSPASITMSSGQTINLQYASGDISLSGGLYPNDPNGSGYFTGGSSPNTIPGYYIAPRAPGGSLIGGFANAAGNLIAPPFFIGSNNLVGPAPAGTTQLLLGVNDSIYNDNTGSWVINIVPSTYYSTLYGAWERGAYSNKADFKMEAGTWQLTALIPESILYPGTTTSLMQTINQGLLSGAVVTVQTLYWPLGSPPSSGIAMGTMQLTQGQIGNS